MTIDQAAALVHELISDRVARTPDAPAVVWADGSLDFAGLDAAANRLARTLRERGVGPEVPVLVAVPGSAELAVALLGVLKAGGVYVPVDPAAPATYLLAVTIHCGASFVLTTAGAEVALPASAVLRVDATPPAADPGAPDVAVLPDNAAYLPCTSSATGQPRGVLVTHRNVVAYLRGLAASGPSLMARPMFDSSITTVLGALAGGGAVHVVDEDGVIIPSHLSGWGVIGRHGPIGRPLPGVRVYVLDRWQEPVPLGRRGELYVGGPQVTRGYRGSAAATAAAFLPDPFTDVPGARMYRTGDLVRLLPDGSLVYCAGYAEWR